MSAGATCYCLTTTSLSCSTSPVQNSSGTVHWQCKPRQPCSRQQLPLWPLAQARPCPVQHTSARPCLLRQLLFSLCAALLTRVDCAAGCLCRVHARRGSSWPRTPVVPFAVWAPAPLAEVIETGWGCLTCLGWTPCSTQQPGHFGVLQCIWPTWTESRLRSRCPRRRFRGLRMWSGACSASARSWPTSRTPASWVREAPAAAVWHSRREQDLSMLRLQASRQPASGR